MFVNARYEAVQYDGTNITDFENWIPGLCVSPSGVNMLCQQDGGEVIVEPGDYLIRRPGELNYVKGADFATWWA